MIRTKLSGQSIAKGRNGYYKIGAFELLELTPGNGTTPAEGRCIHLDFMSTRPQGEPGARVRLTMDDARALLETLQCVWPMERDEEASL